LAKKKDVWTDDDDIFTEFGRMFEDIRQRMDLMRSQTGLTPESMPLSYSYRVYTGPNGEREVTERYDDQMDDGKTHDTRIGPLVDVREREDGVTVIVQLPGVSKEEIDLEVVDKVLVIKADHASRRFEHEVALPCPVNPSIAGSEYHNGVLEIHLAKPVINKRRSSKKA
jgi:HSP20 family protein